jgi:hypothetical protein
MSSSTQQSASRSQKSHDCSDLGSKISYALGRFVHPMPCEPPFRFKAPQTSHVLAMSDGSTRTVPTRR